MNYEISFIYNEKKVEFSNNRLATIYIGLCNWLYKNGYKFEGDVHDAFIRKPLSKKEAENILAKNYSGTYNFNQIFFNIEGSDIYLYRGGNINKIYPNIIKMLVNFGIPESLIKTKGLDETKPKIKKFDDIDDGIEPDIEKEVIPTTDPIKKIKIFAKNPFRQSVCVLGDPGAGKSVTVRNILRNEGYKFQIWEPTAATTGLLSQFSPSKPGYIPSKVGNMMIAASQDPENLYTFVIDEFHKSSIIEMVNDELKHAISLRRYEGDRFIPYEDSTEYLSEYLKEDDGGNLSVPDNFGFIFISSKPRVIANNGDIFDRIDIVILKHHEEEKIQSVSELLSKVLSPEEKKKLAATRND